MSNLWLLERLGGWGDQPALANNAESVTYRGLIDGVAAWQTRIAALGISPGKVVAFEGDYSAATVTLLLALLDAGAVAVPLSSAVQAQKGEFLTISGAEFLFDCRTTPGGDARPLTPEARPPLLNRLKGHPGLILFSSGSTGKAKAMLHDGELLLAKYQTPRPPLRLLTFLLLDHIGGVNTLFSGLANGGTVVTVSDRSPDAVCAAVARHRVEVLPASPTFLNLLLLSGAQERHDLSSLRLITYGTEVMPAATLARLQQAFPGVRLQQTYGLSELGILRSQSRPDGSLWVRVGGEGYETRVVDGVLWIRAQTAMLGYLNAPDPFDAEGWFNTQDAVEVDGEWLRFRGRTSEIINVGGQKAYPAEVESVLLEMEGVLDATVRGEPHPLVGQCVTARVSLSAPETPAAFRQRMRHFCQGRLPPYMIPVKVEVVEECAASARGKKLRRE